VDSAALEARLVSRHAHVPLARALARRSGNRLVADRVALAVVREAQRARLSPSLVAGVLLIENTPLDTSAVSHAGAVGLMQVMPFHAGTWGCLSAVLTQLDANICHGTQVLRSYVRRSRTMSTALRRYNGCMGQYATPTCRRYPARVLRTASSLRREMLATAARTGRSRDGGGVGAMASARAR
jgi:soluble lytic murein transglycosylase-like protein